MTVQHNLPQAVELRDVMEKFSDRGCAIGLCFSNGFPAWHHFSYAPEFLRRYEEDDLAKSDSTLARGFSQDGIFLWSDIEAASKPSKTMKVARSFGMIDGICFSDTVNGFKSIASLSLTSTQNAEAIPVDEILERLQLAALAVSRAVIQPNVSPKVIEYLGLAARGKRDEEIAESLGMSVHGVRRRRQSAMTQLDAQTLPQAVARATSLGLVNVYQNV